MTEELRENLPLLSDEEERTIKTLMVLTPDSDNDSLLALGQYLAAFSPVMFMGIVPVKEGENLSAAAAVAGDLRKLIQKHTDRVNLYAKPRIRVTYTPWDDIRVVLAEETGINLLILEWPTQMEYLRLTAAEILSHPPCDVALFRGPFPEKLNKILVPNIGDPHAEAALRLSLSLTYKSEAEITSLHIHRAEQTQQEASTFAGMRQVLDEMPDVKHQNIEEDDPASEILKTSGNFDLVVMGTRAAPTESTSSLGKITDEILQNSPAAVIAVKTKRFVSKEDPSQVGSKAISVLVDRWFAENTFHAEEFANLSKLLAIKQEKGLTISLALPALNEEATIGDVIHATQRVLMEQVPLLDEIVLLDSNSTDRTRAIAADLGVPVYIHQEILPEYGARTGKGEALWKSLYVTNGDLVLWVDTDITNFHPRFVYGLIGPLLYRNSVKFVKGFYRRPMKTGSGLKPGRGGRVTELAARPMLNLFYPGLSGVIQPLSGEYGGRRDLLEQLPFSSGYGVETGLLIDIYEKFRLPSIAQVDLLERIHKNQSLTNLSKMSFAIIQTLIRKLERRYGQAMMEDVNRSMKIVRYEPGQYYLEVEEIAELERPPMLEIPAYREKMGLPPLSTKK
ncbi:MAG: glucosyl-3-phosphoglycerate synthase [Anaerolineales bacterium]|nr:glucosyl-3-phosphoglycerate synthase [Anaerolineales bacterium]